MRLIFILFGLLAAPVAAQDLPNPLRCSGSDPDWSLKIEDSKGTFDFQRVSELDLMLETSAQGRDWPVALTLIGRGDSVILIVDQGLCNGDDHGARVLTQRGETPLLLVGCCQRD